MSIDISTQEQRGVREHYTLAPYHERFPEKVEAWRLFNNALRRGALVRQPCEVCGVSGAHGHHPDYAKPLDVMWLCALHHVAWHTEHGQGLNGGDPDTDYAPHRASDLLGMTFGHLTIIGATTRNKRGSRLWACRCSCGRRVLKTAMSLLHPGGTVRCRACNDSARVARDNRRRANWAASYLRYGALYGDHALRSLEGEIRADFDREFGPTDPPMVASFGQTRTAGLEQFLDAPSTVAPDGATLHDLGKHFGVTRERIRQVEAIALDKLRRRLLSVEESTVPLRDVLGMKRDVQRTPIRRPKRCCSVCGSAVHTKRKCTVHRKAA